MNPKKIATVLLHSKFGKLLPVLLIAGLTATASATVFVMYYGGATATVQTADITLVKGGDISSSCSAYPCATATIASSKDYATVGISLFPSVAQSNTMLQPATYYTDLLEVNNGGSGSHTINSIAISNIAQSGTDFGNVTVFYCPTQATTPTLLTTSCASFGITSTSGGSLSGNSALPHSLAASGIGYIEVLAYAKSTATAADTITFAIAISWV